MNWYRKILTESGEFEMIFQVNYMLKLTEITFVHHEVSDLMLSLPDNSVFGGGVQ